VSITVEASQLAESYFTPAEFNSVATAGEAQQSAFLQLWSLKEAALKSIGEGLPFGMDAFGFELGESVCITKAPADHGGPPNFIPHLYQWPDVYASIVGRRLIRL
jgi:4'-phosphopantetheinyl transferase